MLYRGWACSWVWWCGGEQQRRLPPCVRVCAGGEGGVAGKEVDRCSFSASGLLIATRDLAAPVRTAVRLYNSEAVRRQYTPAPPSPGRWLDPW